MSQSPPPRGWTLPRLISKHSQSGARTRPAHNPAQVALQSVQSHRRLRPSRAKNERRTRKTQSRTRAFLPRPGPIQSLHALSRQQKQAQASQVQQQTAQYQIQPLFRPSHRRLRLRYSVHQPRSLLSGRPALQPPQSFGRTRHARQPSRQTSFQHPAQPHTLPFPPAARKALRPRAQARA